MHRATATLVLLIAYLVLWAPQAGRQAARVAAEDPPTATIAALAVAEATATPSPAATPDPTATIAQIATATLDPAPTAASLPTATSTPVPPAEPTPTSETSEPTQTPKPAAPTSTAPLAESPAAVSRASEESPLSLSVAAEAVSFGRVTARGEMDQRIAGLSSAVDEQGAFYVLAGAVSVTVEAGVPFTGACAAIENAGTAVTVAVAAGRLEWRLAGTVTWTPFSASTPDLGCFPKPDLGMNTFVYDLRLRVEADDPPGTFQTVLVFTVEP